ncbi:hypothetical protein FA95DRAFT_138342 [Auriscalpium vulgare]|uniref:Uncharacterized protein n=1 Tax=Auriscalpium vulgare TaxID=40419 RepID=A0ACB8S786_9AGAM|nr:hypothetical protein FA95DRAFT_138342 [Auriscalpium vulgare]
MMSVASHAPEFNPIGGRTAAAQGICSFSSSFCSQMSAVTIRHSQGPDHRLLSATIRRVLGPDKFAPNVLEPSVPLRLVIWLLSIFLFFSAASTVPQASKLVSFLSLIAIRSSSLTKSAFIALRHNSTSDSCLSPPPFTPQSVMPSTLHSTSSLHSLT